MQEIAYLSREDDIPNTYAGRLVGVNVVVIIVRLLPETSRCKIILVVRVAWNEIIFDILHRLFAASLTC
jgi:hypothetical protein